MLGHIQIQVVPEGQQGISGPRAFPCQIHRLQAPLQTFVAYIVAFPLSKHRLDEVPCHLILYQHRREKGQVFLQHRVLQSDTGGGNENWLIHQPPGGAAPTEHDAGHQIGIGFTDPRPGIAQGDAVIQHGIQHFVTQGHLDRTLCHTVGGEKFFENVIDLLMGILPVILFHP